MTFSFFAISAIGLPVEGLLLWRLLSRRLFRCYPYFSAFVLCDFVCNLVLIAVASVHQVWFRFTSGAALIVSALMGFLIIWEVLRAVFPRHTTLRSLARNILLGICLFALPSILMLGWSQANVIHFPYKYVPPVFEQYLTLAQAVLLLAVAALAGYYRLPLGRNIRGLVFGFGLYLSLCAVNFATLQIVSGFLPYWQLLSPALYIGLLVFWIWAFWEYSPVSNSSTIHSDAAWSKAQWNHVWQAALMAVRRSHN
jgi:hypothetical protein